MHTGWSRYDAKLTCSADYSIFVGDLGFEIDDNYLTQFFQTYYGSVRSAKVCTVLGHLATGCPSCPPWATMH